MRKFLLVFLSLILILTCGYRKPYRYTIDAGKDAFYHNNVGLNYLQDRIYYAAIQEFKIAIQLSPNTQATAVFKSNLGETYMYIGYPDMARTLMDLLKPEIDEEFTWLWIHPHAITCSSTYMMVQ